MSLDGRPDTPAQRRELTQLAEQLSTEIPGLSVQAREYVEQWMRYRLRLRDAVPWPTSRPVRIASATLKQRADAVLEAHFAA